MKDSNSNMITEENFSGKSTHPFSLLRYLQIFFFAGLILYDIVHTFCGNTKDRCRLYWWLETVANIIKSHNI